MNNGDFVNLLKIGVFVCSLLLIVDELDPVEMSFVPPQYTDLHRSFLQILMNRRMISKTNALSLFRNIYDSETARGSLRENEYCKKMEDAVSLINKVIKRFCQEIRSAEDENTCEMFYLFIFTEEKAIMRKLNKYTADELEYFKNILHEIVTSNDRYVSSTVCLNLNTVLSKHMTKSDMENLLDKFCNDLWLVQQDGKISLSLLSIVELEPIFTENYDEYIDKCQLCKRIVIQGHRCENCVSLLHLSCVRRYTKGQKTPTCPNCGEEQPNMLTALNNLNLSSDNDYVEPGPSRGSRKKKYH